MDLRFVQPEFVNLTRELDAVVVTQLVVLLALLRRQLTVQGLFRLLRQLGEYFLQKLRAMDSHWIKEVRGLGLWIGLELTAEAGGARRFCEALAVKGLLCKETHETTIRFAPPLCISREDLDWALERVAEVFRELD